MILRFALLLSLIFALGLIDGLYSRVDDLIVAESKAKAEAKKAQTYAAVITGCLNGQFITIDNKPVVRCWRVR